MSPRVLALALTTFFVSTAYAQPIEIDLGIDLANPEFAREFSGSFETGLYADAPIVSPRENVILAVVSDMYVVSVDDALSFIRQEIRNEENRAKEAQRNRSSGGENNDFGYSATIEFTMAQLYQLQGNRQLAEENYLAAIEKYPSYMDAFVRLMEIYLYQDDCDKAIAAGKRAVEIGGTNAFVFKGFGLCYYSEQNFAAALSAFRIARSFLPDDDSLDQVMAISAMNTGHFDEAAVVLQELVNKNPQAPAYYFLLVNNYLATNDIDSALALMEIAHRKELLNPETFGLLGNLYIKKEMPEKALLAYQSGLQFETRPDFKNVLEQFNALSRYDWQLTQTYITDVIESYDAALSGANTRLLRVMQARVLINAGKPTDGAELLREVIAEAPRDGDALISLARYYRQQQDFERAAVFYERAVVESSVALEASMEYAQLASDQQNWALAIELLTAAKDLAPVEAQPIILENLYAVQRIMEIARR